jgi:hypothetical protein
MRPLSLHEEIHIVKSLVSEYIFSVVLSYYWKSIVTFMVWLPNGVSNPTTSDTSCRMYELL